MNLRYPNPHSSPMIPIIHDMECWEAVGGRFEGVWVNALSTAQVSYEENC